MLSRHKHHLSRFYFIIPNRPHQMPLAAPPSLQTEPQGPWQRQRQEAVADLERAHTHTHTHTHTHKHTRAAGSQPRQRPRKTKLPRPRLVLGAFLPEETAPHSRDQPPSTPCSLDSAPSPAQTETGHWPEDGAPRKGRATQSHAPRGHAFQRPSPRTERGRGHALRKATPRKCSRTRPSATTPSAPGSWGSREESQKSESVSLSVLSDSQRLHGL